ncbi:GNAT family N-acetyltransferase [Streptomyces sp. NPDC052077]|uniref:GNAT family N-acetyltransferase n=1 Tax=Streptomyces sp. NPDC052077 TaxID=3154757 RepID=UPI0034407D81
MTEAVAGSVALLRTAVDRDWDGTPAAGPEWSCRTTAEHLAETLFAYAGRLAVRAADARVPFGITLDEGTGPADVLHVLETAGALLAAAAATAPADARAFHPHPHRSAGREGFAAMGVTEVLAHTHDIATGLGLVHEPSAELCAYALTRIFPHVPPGPDPLSTLLWATGRGELPGRTRPAAWEWRNNLVLPAGRLRLHGLTPAAALDLATGGDGGFDWVASGPFQGTRDASRMLVTAYEAGAHRPEWGVFVLVRAEDGRAVGAIGFHGPPNGENRAEIGYDLAVDGRGRGYATEALRALSAWPPAREGGTRLLAMTEPDNTASQAVLTRAGYVLTRREEETGLLVYELPG